MILSVNQGRIGINRSVATNRNVRPAQNGRSVELVGTLTEVNQILAADKAVIYQPDANFSGTDTLSVTASDRGKNGTANATWDWPVNALAPRTASSTVLINVRSVNDPPEISLSRGTTTVSAARDNTGSASSSGQSSSASPDTNASVAGNPSQRKNVRAGITTSDAVLFELSVGDRVQIIGRANNQDGYLWYKIYSPTVGQEGWIAQHLLNPD